VERKEGDKNKDKKWEKMTEEKRKRENDRI